MGEYYGIRRRTVEECFTISIFWLNRKGYFCGYYEGRVIWTNDVGAQVGSMEIEVSVGPEKNGGDYVGFTYTITDPDTRKKNHMDYEVDLEKTPCYFGGVRYWFSCPIKNCGRRVGKLYLPLGRIYFACRHCHNLGYRSQQETRRTLSSLVKLL